MEYFYTPPSLIHPPDLDITGEEFSHLTHVMRRKPGDEIRVVDGLGNVYDAVLRSVARGSARCSITSHDVRVNEPEIEVTLAVGILKSNSNFDFLVEKAVEIGVCRIVPLRTERTIPKQAKVDRWRKIALAAMKQSGRCVLPDVRPLTGLREFLSTAPAPRKLIPHEKVSGPSLHEAAKGTGHVCLCIGPEGGFSDEEIRIAREAGFAPVSLGPRRLRTETAAIVATAALLLQAPASRLNGRGEQREIRP